MEECIENRAMRNGLSKTETSASQNKKRQIGNSMKEAYCPSRMKRNESKAAMLLASQISPEAISRGI